MIRVSFAVLFLGLASAQAARAGLPFIGPFSAGNPCVPPDQVTDFMTSPDTAYDGEPGCESLCKKAVAVCKQEVKLNFTCYDKRYASDLFFTKKACDAEFGRDPLGKTCKANREAEVGSARDSVKGLRDTGLGECEIWGITCAGTCS